MAGGVSLRPFPPPRDSVRYVVDARHTVSCRWDCSGRSALVIAIEGLIGDKGDRLASYQGLGARFAAAGASNEAPGCGVLGLGDSVMKFGFDPAEVERGLGVKAYNLAVPGTPPPLTFTLLRRALDAGARPSAVVVCHLTLAGEPAANLAELAEVFSPFDCWNSAGPPATPTSSRA